MSLTLKQIKLRAITQEFSAREDLFQKLKSNTEIEINKILQKINIRNFNKAKKLNNNISLQDILYLKERIYYTLF